MVGLEHSLVFCTSQGLARNLIYVSKMDDAGVKTMFEKETCRMVRGEMVLLKGVWIGTLYKLLGSTISDGCNSSIVPEIGVEEGKNSYSLWRKDYVVASKTGAYQREGPLSTTW
jgi:hypothetical protein